MNRITGTLPVALITMLLVGCDFPSNGAGRMPWDRPASGDAFTIMLYLTSDMGHVEAARRVKKFAESETGWKDIRANHAGNYSAVYWGRFSSAKRAGKKLQRAKRFSLADGSRPFSGAMVVPIDGEDVGPPQWKLTEAPGEYSVLVAVFYDDPKEKYIGRKQFAVDYCRHLRAKGEEAYYHHGSRRSSVTVGSFDHSAVKMVREGNTERLKIVDPKVRAVMARFEFAAVNGRQMTSWTVDKNTGEAIRVKEKSYPIRIPGRKESASDELFHRLRDLE